MHPTKLILVSIPAVRMYQPFGWYACQYQYINWAYLQVTHNGKHLVLMALPVTDGSEGLLFVVGVEAPYSETMVNAHGGENGRVYRRYGEIVDGL